MKTKKFRKKLTINKKTIANLDNTGMYDIKGGITTACESHCNGCPTHFPLLTCPWCTKMTDCDQATCDGFTCTCGGYDAC